MLVNVSSEQVLSCRDTGFGYVKPVSFSHSGLTCVLYIPERIVVLHYDVCIQSTQVIVCTCTIAPIAVYFEHTEIHVWQRFLCYLQGRQQVLKLPMSLRAIGHVRARSLLWGYI